MLTIVLLIQHSHIIINGLPNKKKQILPSKDKFQKQSIYYDLKCKPIDYFLCMISMMKQVENELETIRPRYLCREIKSNQAVLPNCYT